MNEHRVASEDRVAEFHAGRSADDKQVYVMDAFRKEKVALIPMDYGDGWPDQWRMASKIGRLLSVQAAEDGRTNGAMAVAVILGLALGAMLTVVVLYIAGVIH